MNMSAICRGDWDNGASAFPMASGDGPRAARRLVLPAPALFCVLPAIVGGRHRGHHGAAREHGYTVEAEGRCGTDQRPG